MSEHFLLRFPERDMFSNDIVLTSSPSAGSLPLPDETPEIFRMLPEFLIEDITEFLSFTSK